jgi:hypothetical protein
MKNVEAVLSRRSFLFSSAAAAAMPPSIHPAEVPLHVAIVGFGRHAQNLLASAKSSQVYVDAVFDPDPAALRTASEVVRRHQRFSPELVCASRPPNSAHSSSSILLCSPPDTWAALVPALGLHGRPVLAFHTQLFSMPWLHRTLPANLDQVANLLIIGLDPCFPLTSLQAFHTTARSRGASRLSYKFWHPGWDEAQLLAFQFDCLNGAMPDDVASDDDRNSWQFVPLSLEPNRSISRVSRFRCSISAAGSGIAFGAGLDIEENTMAQVSSPVYFSQFAAFCRAGQSVKRRLVRRQFTLMEMVHASSAAMSVFS